MHEKPTQWQTALHQRECTHFRDDLDEIVACLPYWQRTRLRVWLRQQEAEEPAPDDELTYTRNEIDAMLPLVPQEQLRLLLGIVRLFASGR